MIQCIEIKQSDINAEYDLVKFQKIVTTDSNKPINLKSIRTVTKGYVKGEHKFKVGKVFYDVDIVPFEHEKPVYDGHKTYTNGKYYTNEIVKKYRTETVKIPNIYFPVVKKPNQIVELSKLNGLASLEAPIKPTPPVEPTHNKSSLFFFIGGIILLFIWKEGGTVISALSVIAVLISWLNYKNNMASYRNQLQNYHAELQTYKLALNKYNNLADIFRTAPLGVSQAKRICIEKILDGVTSFPTTDDVKRGAAEKHFQQFLVKWFPKEIYTNLTDGEYAPDFVFKCSLTNLHIDIEIDEPYTLDTGEPIHYFEPDGVSSDLKRDQHFDIHNWAVIRFSEQQVVKTPNECCKVIADLIFEITGNRAYLNRLEAAGFEAPVYELRWGYYDATELAKDNYREKYLVEAGIMDALSFTRTIDNRSEMNLNTASRYNNDLPF